MSQSKVTNPEAGDGFKKSCNDNKEISFANNQIKCQDHLKNWEIWINRRKSIHSRLKKIGRNSGDMVMNLGDDVRLINEERQLFWSTRIEDKFDKYRGNPAFWNFPLALRNKEPPFYRNPIYFAVQSKEDKNEIPIIHYVGTPAHIKKEKDIDHGKRDLKRLWQIGNYRTSVWIQKQTKIQHIEPHRPEYDDLIILGTKIKLKPQENNIDESKHNAPNTDHEDKETSVFQEMPRESGPSEISAISKAKFKINKIEIYENCDLVQTRNRKISVLFEYELGSTSPEMKSICFQNTGETTIKFYWSQHEKFRLFRDFKVINRQYTFSFNKNEFLLIPGQQLNLPVWFEAKKHGNYVEFWELVTAPKLWDVDFQLLVCFQGFAEIKDFVLKSQSARTVIDSKVRETVIKDIVSDILDNLKYPNFGQVPCKFDEKQLFESANLKICLANRVPKYVYNNNIAKELKKFYLKVKQPHHPAIWDMSIENLKKITREKDILTFCEKKMEDFIIGKNRRHEFANVDQSKQRNVTSSVAAANSILESAMGKETYFQKLQKLLQKLGRPSMIKNTQREKQAQVYNIFNTFFNKMSKKLHEIDLLFSCQVLDFPFIPTFNNFEQDRMVFESFDDIWVSRIKRVLPECKMEYPAFPKSPLLTNIPSDDVKKIYKVYFNMTDTEDDKKNKKKKGEAKVENAKGESKKSNKGDKEKSTKTRSEVAELSKPTIRENFDPFLELFTPKEIKFSEMYEPERNIPPSGDFVKDSVVFYERYIAVYTHLGEAIDAMVDCIETLKTDSVTSDVLGTLQEYKEVSALERKDTVETIKEVVEQAQSQETRPVKEMQKSMLTEMPRTLEDNMYFDYLVMKHWKQNKNTKKYIINGTICDKTKQMEVKEKSEETLVNVFTDPSEWMKRRSLEEYSTCESKCIQTSDVDEDFTISNILLTESRETLTKERSIVSQDIVKSTDMFYILEESSMENGSEK